MTEATSLETKGAGGETARAFEEFLEAFKSFKETNDQRLVEIEQRGASDPLIAEKLARIEETLDSAKRASDNLALKAARPHLAGGNMASASQLAHKAAFDGYVRRGDASRLARIEEKALSAGSSPDGGYLVPPETEAAVNGALKAISPMRAIAGIRQVSSSVYNRPFATTGVGTGWTAETASRSQTTTPTLANLQFPTMELYAMPAASQTLLDDTIVNIDEWLAEEVRIAFAEQEGTAFLTGDGTNKPKGFLSYDTVANASWAWGKLGFVSTGTAGAFPATAAGDKLLDLIYAAKAPYRANGTFMMSRATVAAVRKLKDGDGNYLWQPANTAGEWPSLMGYPVAESEDMPDIADAATAIAFGDFSRGYLIVDRAGIRVLRDPYSAKPYVLFYTTKRVGGGVQDFDAIKLLKFADNAGYGVKSLDDLHQIIGFFEERRGRLHAFRWRDPMDWKSCPPNTSPSELDAVVGTGDGTTAAFQLKKIYGSAFAPWARDIKKPVAGTVTIAVAGSAADPGTNFTFDPSTGIVTFLAGHIPADGQSITAGFEFDVPVRFDTDKLEINLSGFTSGAIPNIPIVEVRL